MKQILGTFWKIIMGVLHTFLPHPHPLFASKFGKLLWGSYTHSSPTSIPSFHLKMSENISSIILASSSPRLTVVDRLRRFFHSLIVLNEEELTKWEAATKKDAENVDRIANLEQSTFQKTILHVNLVSRTYLFKKFLLTNY